MSESEREKGRGRERERERVRVVGANCRHYRMFVVFFADVANLRLLQAAKRYFPALTCGVCFRAILTTSSLVCI